MLPPPDAARLDDYRFQFGHDAGNLSLVLDSLTLTGVFYTRSPARPNPLGLHPVTVREIDGTRVKIGPIEVFDGTPVVDIKSASTRADG